MMGFALSLHFSPPLHETFQVSNERKIKLRVCLDIAYFAEN